MWIFFDPEGVFKLAIPNEWEFRNDKVISGEDFPFSFELREDILGCFQITQKDLDFGNIPSLIEDNNLKPQGYYNADIKFKETKEVFDEFEMIVWFAVVEDKFILGKYVYNKNLHEKVKPEIDKSKKALATLEVIPKENRHEEICLNRFERFYVSRLAAIDLRKRALKKESFLELIILVANDIDAILRITIILFEQLKSNSDQIDIKMIYQGDKDTPISEREIYIKAYKNKIITSEIFDNLNSLYNKRNKAIHRYIISDLKTIDIIKLSYDYFKILESLENILIDLEKSQFNKKIGIYKNTIPERSTTEEEIHTIKLMIQDKHGF